MELRFYERALKNALPYPIFGQFLSFWMGSKKTTLRIAFWRVFGTCEGMLYPWSAYMRFYAICLATIENNCLKFQAFYDLVGFRSKSGWNINISGIQPFHRRGTSPGGQAEAAIRWRGRFSWKFFLCYIFFYFIVDKFFEINFLKVKIIWCAKQRRLIVFLEGGVGPCISICQTNEKYVGLRIALCL